MDPACDYDFYAYFGNPAKVLQLVDACKAGLSRENLIDGAEKLLLRANIEALDWYKPWLDGTQALFILVTTNTGAMGWVAIGPGPRSALRYEDSGISVRHRRSPSFTH